MLDAVDLLMGLLMGLIVFSIFMGLIALSCRISGRLNTRYRIATRNSFYVFEVWRWWFPIWTRPHFDDPMHDSVEDAREWGRNYIRSGRHVCYLNQDQT